VLELPLPQQRRKLVLLLMVPRYVSLQVGEDGQQGMR